MKTLLHYELEGLVDNRGYTVWIPLGRFATREAAQANVGRSRGSQVVLETRITPLFRDSSGGYARLDQPAETLTLRRPAQVADNSHRAVPTTVA